MPAVLANYFQPINPSTTANYLVGKTWEVSEKLTTAYIMGKLDHELSPDVSLRGNVGVQIVHTDQSSSSNAFVSSGPNGVTPISDDTAPFSSREIVPAS